MREGRRSFPSGHTSTCFAGLGLLSLFLAAQLGVFDGQGYVFKLVLSLLPLFGAGLVGLSRIADYRHHWQDVLGGAVLGFFTALFCYLLYFPAPWREDAHEPHPHRFEEIERSLPHAPHQDEFV